MLTRRPGTTTTFFAGLPSIQRSASGDASAAASMAALSAPAGTRTLPRVLPQHLQHQLDLVLHQRGLVDRRPAGVEQLLALRGVAEVRPQRPA